MACRRDRAAVRLPARIPQEAAARPAAGGPAGTRGRQRRWQAGQNVVPRPPSQTFRSGVRQRGQGRPAWP